MNRNKLTFNQILIPRGGLLSSSSSLVNPCTVIKNISHLRWLTVNKCLNVSQKMDIHTNLTGAPILRIWKLFIETCINLWKLIIYLYYLFYLYRYLLYSLFIKTRFIK